MYQGYEYASGCEYVRVLNRGDTHMTSTLRESRGRRWVGGEVVPWPDIMLIIYYWQEIFLLTLTSDSEAIL